MTEDNILKYIASSRGLSGKVICFKPDDDHATHWIIQDDSKMFGLLGPKTGYDIPPGLNRTQVLNWFALRQVDHDIEATELELNSVISKLISLRKKKRELL